MLFLDGTQNDKDSDKKRFGRKCEVGNGKNTHGSMSGGTWTIDDDDLPEFYKLYCEHLRTHGPLHMTEKSTKIGALRVDLDFVYNGRHENHIHTQDQVIHFIGAYMTEVKRFLQLPDSVEIFVSEKPEPTYYFANPSKSKPDYSKSGIHIVIPDLKTTHYVEEEIRRTLLKNMPTFFPELPLSDKWEKVYDPSPLTHTNNWTLLGSKKQEGTPYLIKYILDWDSETGEISIDNDVPIMATSDLLNKMSVRSPPSMETQMTDEGNSLFKKKMEEEEIRKSMGMNRGRQATRNENDDTKSRGSTPERNAFRQLLSQDRIDYFKDHVMNLHEDRYNKYDEWIKVGICLKNIHPESLETVFYDFSSQFKDYDPRKATSKWDSFTFRSDGPVLSETSLLSWSRMDNLVGYKEIESRNIDFLVKEAAKTLTEHDVAKLVHAMFRNEFKCSDYGQNHWYRFTNHVWKYSPRGVSLLARLSSDVWREFVKKEEEIGRLRLVVGACTCQSKKKGEEADENCELCKLERQKSRFIQAQMQMKKTAFKRNVMEECKLLCLDEDLAQKLDTNKNLIAFNNGIFDMTNPEKPEFRDGKHEDYVSFTTDKEYHEDKKYHEHKCWPELWNFLTGILPDEEVRMYFLNHLASCIIGGNPAQKFHILTGSGSNGKSMLMILLETCLGMYACKAPITLLTQDRGRAGVASPELLRMKGKRFVTMQEPEEGANIKTGLMKELSSCEKITARDLFAGSKEMIDIDIQAHFHLCCNNKPNVNAQDGGTWRRLCVVNFTNKFVSNPTKPGEVQEDKSIQYKVESVEWAEAMISFIIHLFKEDKGAFRKLVPPQKVLEYTNEYKNESDVLARFITEHIHPLDADALVETPSKVTTGEINRAFQLWKSNNRITTGSTTDLKKRLEEQYGPFPKGGWSSFQFVNA